MVFLGMFGGQEIIVVAILILLMFGGKKLPELMRGLGKGIREFKNATNSIKEEIEEASPIREQKNLDKKEHNKEALNDKKA